MAPRPRRTGGWAWRVADLSASARMRLRYEPGGWGDLLKGIVAVEIAAHLHDGGARPLSFADPFAGAPDYPIVPATEDRLAAASGSRFDGVVRALGGGRLPSTAAAILGACGGDASAAIFDADGARREAWRGRAGVTILEVADGVDALAPEGLGPRDLVVIDPYDLDRPDMWRALLPRAARLQAGGSHLLLYHFHRQSRPPDLASYRAFRRALVAELGAPALVGRVPSDRLLPRAWHEVILCAGVGPRVPLAAPLLERLGQATQALAFSILGPGLVERGEAAPPAGSG